MPVFILVTVLGGPKKPGTIIVLLLSCSDAEIVDTITSVGGTPSSVTLQYRSQTGTAVTNSSTYIYTANFSG